jgi:uncharacterized cupredoxin-like copper-binding protein
MRRLFGGSIVLVLAALAIGVATAPAGRHKAAATTVNVKLLEFKLIPAPTKVKAGSVTFVVRNAGKIDHQFVVIKTSVPAAKLPMKGVVASEAGLVRKIAVVRPNQTGRLTLNLKQGKYVLICNLPAHYKAGQYAAFVVG